MLGNLLYTSLLTCPISFSTSHSRFALPWCYVSRTAGLPVKHWTKVQETHELKPEIHVVLSTGSDTKRDGEILLVILHQLRKKAERDKFLPVAWHEDLGLCQRRSDPDSSPTGTIDISPHARLWKVSFAAVSHVFKRCWYLVQSALPHEDYSKPVLKTMFCLRREWAWLGQGQRPPFGAYENHMPK